MNLSLPDETKTKISAIITMNQQTVSVYVDAHTNVDVLQQKYFVYVFLVVVVVVVAGWLLGIFELHDDDE